MEDVLLDTNVFSYFLRRNDTRADLYYPYVQYKTLVVSFVTVGELYY
jgi:predicted nucleic acid-binding protein